jgi:hypothetical protein
MEEQVTISLKDYQNLKWIEANYDALEAAGVDNWSGYDECDWPKEEDFLGENGVRP